MISFPWIDISFYYLYIYIYIYIDKLDITFICIILQRTFYESCWRRTLRISWVSFTLWLRSREKEEFKHWKVINHVSYALGRQVCVMRKADNRLLKALFYDQLTTASVLSIGQENLSKMSSGITWMLWKSTSITGSPEQLIVQRGVNSFTREIQHMNSNVWVTVNWIVPFKLRNKRNGTKHMKGNQ